MLPEFLNVQTIVVFVIFIIVVFILYKMFKIILRATLVAAAAFSFPWIAQALGLPITADIQTAIYFTIFGLSLFIIYEFFHFVAYFFRMLAWPFRAIAQKKRQRSVEEFIEKKKKSE